MRSWAITRMRSGRRPDRKSTRLNSSHLGISYAVFCLKKKHKDRPPTKKGHASTSAYGEPGQLRHGDGPSRAGCGGLPGNRSTVLTSVFSFFFNGAGPPQFLLLSPPRASPV